MDAKVTVVTVENPVTVACKVVSSYGKGEKNGKLTRFEPWGIVAGTQATAVVAHLNATKGEPRGEKTTREYVVMDDLPVIIDANSMTRLAKRAALKAIPDGVRATLGLPAPDADDATIDAYNAPVAK
jgi:hypothetical protein